MARKQDKTTIHDRLSADLPINSRVAVVVVDDPIERGGKLRVMRSLRDDVLAGLHARDQIDDAMLTAGRKWQQYFELAEIGGVCAIDTTKEPVDGGGWYPEPLSDTQRRAVKELARADQALGLEGSALIRSVLIERQTMAYLAVQRELPERYGKEYLGRRFRECLDTLALLWGTANRPVDYDADGEIKPHRR